MGAYIIMKGIGMINFIKWIAVIIVAPILLLKEVWTVVQAIGFDFGSPDDLLAEAKKEVKTPKKKKNKKKNSKEETIIIVE